MPISVQTIGLLIASNVFMTVFVPFAVFYMRQGIDWNFLWAGLCLLGAVYFTFR